jgi:competence protein ComEA
MRKLLIIMTFPLLFAGTAFGAVNINTATEDELRTLSGITAAKAKAIIDYRSKAGKFKATEDLAKVDGVNEQHLDMKQLYREATVTGPTVLKTKEKSAVK